MHKQLCSTRNEKQVVQQHSRAHSIELAQPLGCRYKIRRLVYVMRLWCPREGAYPLCVTQLVPMPHLVAGSTLCVRLFWLFMVAIDESRPECTLAVSKDHNPLCLRNVESIFMHAYWYFTLYSSRFMSLSCHSISIACAAVLLTSKQTFRTRSFIHLPSQAHCSPPRTLAKMNIRTALLIVVTSVVAFGSASSHGKAGDPLNGPAAP